uniref:uncharacterized protein LOC122596509 n=1 Tax=Erigeron canadensis TaxID=72917 RepID=UPI001CB98A26|nr:uncharacterized protein LOC122596509 [Erigeron canadensis]
MEIQNSNNTSAAQTNVRKRSITDMTTAINNIHHSNCFKIRALIKDLRPHFLQVLRTPDFQTSKSAVEINQQMKLLMKLYEEMTSNTVTLDKSNTVADGGHDQKKTTDVKPSEPPIEKEKNFIRKSSEERPASDKQVSQGSYIVGGSAFGWNFIMYPTSQLSAYYGRTKEDFRAANPIPTTLPTTLPEEA